MHIDRCDALVHEWGGRALLIGVEIFGKSETYIWPSSKARTFEKVTLFPNGLPLYQRQLRLTQSLVRAISEINPSAVFFCHYELPAIWAAAAISRMRGRHVFVMNNSRFEDKERFRLRELAKALFLLPYEGALVAGEGSRSYLEFLGMSQSRIALGYNTVSVKRIQRLCEAPPAPEGAPFSDRHFSIIARFVPKKNLATAIEAYGEYVKLVPQPRALHIAGYGPDEPALRKLVSDLGLSHNVIFRGALQIEGVSEMYSTTLALILTSIEEQFGNVVIEAQATGLPVIISDRCGAWEVMVQSGVNGFVAESDNAPGYAYFMSLLSEDEGLWRAMALAARQSARRGDVERFVEGVNSLIGPLDSRPRVS